MTCFIFITSNENELFYYADIPDYYKEYDEDNIDKDDYDMEL